MRTINVTVLLTLALTAAASSEGSWDKRAPKKQPATYKEWIQKGENRWKVIQKALTDEAEKAKPDEPETDFCNQGDVKWWIAGEDAAAVGPSGRYKEFIEATKLPISDSDPNNFNIRVGYPWNGDPNPRKVPTTEDPKVLRYDNYFNPTDNVIVAEDLWKGSKGTDLQPYSRPTWTMWSKVKAREGKGSPKDLKALVHYTCANDGAKAVAYEICTDAEKDPIIEVKTLLPGSDEFNAVLGIDNGATALGIVTQHKKALGYKSISSITVWCSGTPLMGVSYNLG